MLIAGGGTGGHLFPGMAVAEEFIGRGPAHEVLFVGTAKGIEAGILPGAGYEFTAIRSRGLAGMGVVSKLRGLCVLPLSIIDAAREIRRFKPRVALGVGGYVSGPAILAAWLMGVPCAIQEQNAVPGMTNRILGLIAGKVFISFEQARAWFGRADKNQRVVVSGNPIRKPIVEALLDKPNKAHAPAAAVESVKMLVVGGSQGAHGVNVLMMDAASVLARDYGERIVIRHQSGEKDRDAVEERYRELGFEARVEPFIHEMAAAYLEADLVVSRAGAGAVAEIALAGLPAILVPYPFAASDHQAKNAMTLVEAGAATMLLQDEAGARDMADAISEIIDDPIRMKKMAERARAAARPRAAAVVVDHCLELMCLELKN